MDREVRDSGIHQPDDSFHPAIADPPSEDSSDTESASSMPNDDPPVVPRPQQLANIPIFDGERGEGFINWLEAIENAGDAYGWAIDNLLQIPSRTKQLPCLFPTALRLCSQWYLSCIRIHR